MANPFDKYDVPVAQEPPPMVPQRASANPFDKYNVPSIETAPAQPEKPAAPSGNPFDKYSIPETPATPVPTPAIPRPGQHPAQAALERRVAAQRAELEGTTPARSFSETISGLKREQPAAPMAQQQGEGPSISQGVEVAMQERMREARRRFVEAPKGSEAARQAKQEFEKLSRQRTIIGQTEAGVVAEQAALLPAEASLKAVSSYLEGLTAGFWSRKLAPAFFKRGGLSDAETKAMIDLSKQAEGVAQSIGMAGMTMAGSVQLTNSIFNKILPAVQALKMGAVATTITARALTGAISSGFRNYNAVKSGNKTTGAGIRDSIIETAALMVGVLPEQYVKAGFGNFAAQVATDFAFDVTTDKYITGYLEKGKFWEWFTTTELPQLAMSIAMAGRDLMDPQFKGQQRAFREDLARQFRRDVRAANLPARSEPAGFEAAAKATAEPVAPVRPAAPQPVDTVGAPEVVKLNARSVSTTLGIKAKYQLPDGDYSFRVERPKPGTIKLVPVNNNGDPIRLQNLNGEDVDAIVIWDKSPQKAEERLRRDFVSQRPVAKQTSEVPDASAVRGDEAKVPVTRVEPQGGEVQGGRDLRGQGQEPPQGGEGAPARAVAPEGRAESRFPQRVGEVYPETKAELGKRDLTHEVRTDVARDAEARRLADTEPERVLRAVRDPNLKADAIEVVAAQMMVKDALARGDVNRAVDIVEDLTPRTSERGRGLRDLRVIGMLSPEGMLMYAGRQVNKAKAELAKGKTKTPGLEKALRKISLTREDSASIIDRMNKAQAAMRAGDQYGHDFEVAKAVKVWQDKMPSSFLSKVSFFQAAMQLLNPKTAGRNIGGNAILGTVFENLSKTVAVGLDRATSLFTGTRTRSLPSPSTQARVGWAEGKRTAKEIRAGVDTRQAESKFDTPRLNFADDKTRPLAVRGFLAIGRALQNSMRFTLELPDRMFRAGVQADSLRSQMKAAGVDVATPEMVERAIFDGQYATFQRDGVLAKAFMSLKKTLNFGLDFGLGDMFTKYARISGNLLQTGIDYSPAGIVKGIMEFARPAFGKDFRQYKATMDLSRGVVGSGTLLAFLLLAKAGIVTGAGSDDEDVQAMEKATGRGKFRLNISALKRCVLSGFNDAVAKATKGDIYSTYDWAQPMSVPAAIGATAGEAKTFQGRQQDWLGMMVDVAEAGENAFAEQPVVTGLRRAFRALSEKKRPLRILAEAAQDLPASFMPTLAAQIALYLDPTIRNPKDRVMWKQSLQALAKKTPVLSRLVPGRMLSTGEPWTVKNPTLFNIFLNPAITTTYEPTVGTELLTDLYQRGAGDVVKQYPRAEAPKTILVDGKPLALTTAEQNLFMSTVGSLVMGRIDQLARGQSPWNADPDKVAQHIDSKILTPAAERGRREVIKSMGGMEAARKRAKEQGAKR